MQTCVYIKYVNKSTSYFSYRRKCLFASMVPERKGFIMAGVMAAGIEAGIGM